MADGIENDDAPRPPDVEARSAEVPMARAIGVSAEALAAQATPAEMLPPAAKLNDGWSMGSAVLLLFVTALLSVALPLLFGVVAGVAVAASTPADGIDWDVVGDEIRLIIMGPSSLAVQIVVVWLIYRAIAGRGLAFRKALHLVDWSRISAVGFAGVGFSYSVISTMSIHAIGIANPEQRTAWETLYESGAMDWMIAMVLFAPFVEEPLFRGYVYQGFRKKMTMPAAAALVSLVFVAAHIPLYGFNWVALGSVGVVGIALIVILERTRSLAYCIAFHFGVNAFPAFSMLLFDSHDA